MAILDVDANESIKIKFSQTIATIMVNNVGSKIKCGLLMNNVKSPNNVFIIGQILVRRVWASTLHYCDNIASRLSSMIDN